MGHTGYVEHGGTYSYVEHSGRRGTRHASRIEQEGVLTLGDVSMQGNAGGGR